MLAYRVTDGVCDLSTNVSQEAVDAFIVKGAVPAKKMVAMPNGIDSERLLLIRQVVLVYEHN